MPGITALFNLASSSSSAHKNHVTPRDRHPVTDMCEDLVPTPGLHVLSARDPFSQRPAQLSFSKFSLTSSYKMDSAHLPTLCKLSTEPWFSIAFVTAEVTCFAVALTHKGHISCLAHMLNLYSVNKCIHHGSIPGNPVTLSCHSDTRYP